MTPECPKGPESNPPARERVAEYYRTLWGYASHNDQTWQAADRALEAMRPEIEQLLFERDAAQATADNIAQQLEDLRDDVLDDDSLHVLEVASAAGREVERLTAEVELLKEKRAAEARTIRAMMAANEHIAEALGWPEAVSSTLVVAAITRLREERDEWKQAAGAEADLLDQANAEVSRLREQLAAQPQPIDTEWGIRFAQGHVRSQSGEEPAREFVAHWKRGAEVVSRPVMGWQSHPSRGSASSEASPIIHSVLLSSDTGVMGEWQAFCSGCRQRSVGDLAHAEFWKDQHLADVLVPQVQANSKLEQNLELGRPSGSTATPRSDEDEVQAPEFKVGDEVRWCWTGKNADGTWFNARLTEKHPHHYPKGWAGEVTDCGTAYTAEHMGEVPLGFKLFMDIPSLTLASRPSPSLRKEGEDSD